MRRKDDVRYIVHGNPMTGDDLRSLGKWLENAETLSDVSHDLRRVIEKEFPQHAAKLPPRYVH